MFLDRPNGPKLKIHFEHLEVVPAYRSLLIRSSIQKSFQHTEDSSPFERDREREREQPWGRGINDNHEKRGRKCINGEEKEPHHLSKKEKETIPQREREREYEKMKMGRSYVW
ncbi:hypothetical protein Ccrd_026794 [Cynara cardunculus var. scolymus]|uniref:Uncharacterized protein n=1 Tax=Cynara cardunculus var. scolymus TaxID=59895 RepID=A0A103XD50_CYNCS|nr:hypothetical protein Ccrd_026794 [Cynara cardunculus var. scolymus]